MTINLNYGLLFYLVGVVKYDYDTFNHEIDYRQKLR